MFSASISDFDVSLLEFFFLVDIMSQGDEFVI